MKTSPFRLSILTLVVALIVGACNLQFAAPAATDEPAISQQDIALTAAALVLAAQPTATTSPEGAAPAAEAACDAIVTATVNANVRAGPSTDYAVVGSLVQNATAPVAGQSAGGTWWYILFAGGPNGYGWIAASVTTPSCIPAGLAVIPAPPLPPTEVVEAPSGDDDEGPLIQINPGIFQLLKPDLIITEFTINPSTPVMGENTHVRIGAYNQGAIAAGEFKVVWKGLSTYTNPSCSWTVDGMVANGGIILECNFEFQSWYGPNQTSWAKIDSSGQVNESNENNNVATKFPFTVTQ
jgi:hypothetical protein